MSKQGRDLRTEIVGFLERHLQENGYPPTYDEIAQAVGLSSRSHVDYYLELLEEAGRIERRPRTPRGLRLVGSAPATFPLPVEGFIAAGQPIEPLQGVDREIEVTPDMADPRKDLFVLEVRGDSMVDALVGNGDLLIVERGVEARYGKMAVVHVVDRNEVTLKRVFPEGARVRLQPENPKYEPQYVDADNVQVQGLVAGIIRRY